MHLKGNLHAFPIGLMLAPIAAWAAGCDGEGGETAPDGEQVEAGGGASSGAGDDPSPSAGVCPGCAPGGETTDFGGGSQPACALVMLERELGFEQAQALGFDVAAQRAAIEVPIDEPMRWNPQRTEAGGPATGFEPETRVSLELAAVSVVHFELDPDRCDAETCELDDGTRTEAEPCRAYVLVSASGELRTADGAVDVTFEPQPVKVLHGDPEESTDVTVAAQADLLDVEGSLRIDPEVPEPYIGRLDLSLQYAPDGTLASGAIDISVYPDWDDLPEDHEEIPSELSRYAPLRGHFGDAQPDE